MKKGLSLLLVLLLLLSAVTGCSAKSATSDAASKENYGDSGSTDYSVTQGQAAATNPTEDSKSATDVVFTAATTTGTSTMADKIIYSAVAALETVTFDETIKELYTMMDNYGAFLQSSNITGGGYASSYYGYQTYRTADFVIRVPVDSYTKLTDNLGTLGNITSYTTDAQNITTQYTDTQSRLDAYRTEEQSLLKMLAAAVNVSDMLDIESRLSDIRYQIESLTSQLTNWDNSVSFSTVTVHISEVEELSKQVAIQRTYWQQIGDGFTATLNGLWRFLKNVFKAIVIALPVLVLLAVIVAAILLIIRGADRKAKKKSLPPTAGTSDQENKTNK